MQFFVSSDGLRLSYGTEGHASPTARIHRHALQQLASKVGLPMNYVSALQGGDSWRQELLATNLSELYQRPTWTERGGQPVRFLHRLVGGELRGFLSRRFNRHLASAPLLRAFTEQAALLGARPVEASSSPVRSSLKCLLPRVFEAFPGEFVCLGVEFSNSDFGSGRLKVCQTVWRVLEGTGAVLDEGLSRAHIGSVIDESDIEMSDETAQKEVAAQQSAVRDHVKEYLAEATVEKLLTAVRAAHEKQMSWSTLVKRLKEFLGKGELAWVEGALKNEVITDLPPISYTDAGERAPNAYWASSAVSSLALRAEDTDRRMELQREAGRLLASAMSS
jgi:hypothetical protein